MPNGPSDHAAGIPSALYYQPSSTPSSHRSAAAERQTAACTLETDMSSPAERPASTAIPIPGIEASLGTAAPNLASVPPVQSGAQQPALEPARQPCLTPACDTAGCHGTDAFQFVAAKAGPAHVMPDAVVPSGQGATSHDYGCCVMPADGRSIGQQHDTSCAEAAKCHPCSQSTPGLLPVGITTYTGVGRCFLSVSLPLSCSAANCMSFDITHVCMSSIHPPMTPCQRHDIHRGSLLEVRAASMIMGHSHWKCPNIATGNMGRLLDAHLECRRLKLHDGHAPMADPFGVLKQGDLASWCRWKWRLHMQLTLSCAFQAPDTWLQ